MSKGSIPSWGTIHMRTPSKETLDSLPGKDDLSSLLTQHSQRHVAHLLGVSQSTVGRVMVFYDITAQRKGNTRYDKASCSFTCTECGKVGIEDSPVSAKKRKFCSNSCQQASVHRKTIEGYLSGDIDASSGEPHYQLKRWARQYILERDNYQCCACGFDTPHPVTGLTILEVHHVDGDVSNNKPENLQSLCPNCHALTDNHKSRNKGSKRRKAKQLLRNRIKELES